MSLAISAVFIAIILMPLLIGFIVFRNGTQSKRVPKLPILEYFFISATLSLILHAGVIELFGLPVDFELLSKIITATITAEYIQKFNEETLQSYIFGFVKYIALLSFWCAFFGLLLQLLVTGKYFRTLSWLQKLRKNRQPIRSLSYFNSWWYYFRQYEYDGKLNKRSLAYLDIMVEVKEATILYTGFLKGFVIRNGDLDRIYLSEAEKRIFSKNDLTTNSDLEEGKKKSIEPVGIMCIPYCNILNLHIRFIPLPDIVKTVKDKIKPQVSNDSNTITNEIRTGQPG